jgi:2-polyprenyl-6-methoxyphenol hydroxylase-like FAD-dependent oxidoreductase
VLVLEKHADFLRDFRGDTIHPSTTELLHQLGWLEDFLQLPHSRMSQVTVEMGGKSVTFADFSRLKVRCPYIVFMPQWDFLNFIAQKARAYSGFRLMMSTEATDLIQSGGRTVGVRARGPRGEITVSAKLVICADGRRSIVRETGADVLSRTPPMDVLWFRLSRCANEELPFFRPARGRVVICINRGDYWQIAYVIPAGGYEAAKAEGIDTFRSKLVEVYPEFAMRVGELRLWDDVRFLRVSVDRLRKWFRPGLICIGDAAHAMSPAGGVGVNLAVQDAVATANLLGPSLARGEQPTLNQLRRVQRRREFPARIIQFIQVRAAGGLYPKHEGDDPSARMPFLFRLFRILPFLRHVAGRLIGLGVRPERLMRLRRQVRQGR